MFKKCETCKKVWESYLDFISDPEISLTRYQVNFENLELGLFLFTHSCNNNLSITASAFTTLYHGPVFDEKRTGTDSCPEYCLYEDELGHCPIRCECAYIREVLQIVKHWPKKVSE